jgi:uncharacterized protein (UPF0264 family)
MLASVVDAREAEMCVEAGADVIDCKDPKQGALGAVSEDTARAIVEAVGSRVPVSATIGDLPCEAGAILDATLRMAATGVDYVKAGLAPEGDAGSVVRALGAARSRLGKARLVGVLFADTDPDFGLLPEMARAGFAGAVLDTADKAAGPLPGVLGAERLKEFVDAARGSGLFCGLAGSLRSRDIPLMVRLAPDLLGFRGALCREHERTASLDIAAVAEVRKAIAREEGVEETSMVVTGDELMHEERA